MRYVSAIVAGGGSSRFGGDKAMADVAGVPMIAHIARRLGGEKLAVVGHAAAAALLDATNLSDPSVPAQGPLAGVLAALEWAEACGADWVVTAPCDVPLLPRDMADRLVSAAAAAGAHAAHAATDDGLQALCAAWRTDLAPPLRKSLEAGLHPAVRDVTPDAVHVHFDDATAFINVNTPRDLERVAARLADD